MGRAVVEYLDGDGVFYAEIPGFEGVYATGATKEECAVELRSVLEEWIALRLEQGRSLPAASLLN
jgi:predicted RNase H-like HicB family nuclease